MTSKRGGARPGAGRPKATEARPRFEAPPKGPIIPFEPPPDLQGDMLDAWLADREISTLRRKSYDAEPRIAILASRALLGWAEFRRRMRREASPLNDPRVLDLLTVLRRAIATYEALVQQQAAVLADVSPDVANLVPALPSLAEHVDAAMSRAQTERRA